MRDSLKWPELFAWHGSIAPDRMDEWLNVRNLHLPPDLRELWYRTGGGEMFESETILAPFGEEILGDDVDSVNLFHRSQGLPPGYFVFHVGSVGLSAVSLTDQRFVVLRQDDYSEEAEFLSLEEWYSSMIRSEFALRYDLDSPARS